MRVRASLAALAAALLLAACGGDDEPQAEPAPNPIQQRVEPARQQAAEAERQMQASQDAMEAQAREAAGDTSGG